MVGENCASRYHLHLKTGLLTFTTLIW